MKNCNKKIAFKNLMFCSVIHFFLDPFFFLFYEKNKLSLQCLKKSAFFVEGFPAAVGALFCHEIVTTKVLAIYLLFTITNLRK